MAQVLQLDGKIGFEQTPAVDRMYTNLLCTLTHLPLIFRCLLTWMSTVRFECNGVESWSGCRERDIGKEDALGRKVIWGDGETEVAVLSVLLKHGRSFESPRQTS
jgi:hypothetical protein